MVAASALGLGGIAASAVVATGASADTSPTAGLPATVSADALPTVQINGVVWAQVTVGNTVYATGSFTQARPAGVAVGGAGTVTRSNLLAYNITTGVLSTTFKHSLNGQGLAIVASPNGQTVYVGGDFTTVDGVAHNRVAAFSTATGNLISTFSPSLNASVKAIAATNSVVYIGGSFTTASGTSRGHLAAYSSAGSLLSWHPLTTSVVTPTNPTATAIVTAMVVAPDASRVVVAGKFGFLDGDVRTGLGAVDAVTGADEPWAATNPVADYGATSNLTSLTADAGQVYGAGFYFTHGGNFEGRFGLDADTGAINWMNPCHGDSYATFPMGQVLYSASHEHECTDIQSFSQTTPGPIQSLHHFAAAETTFPTGTVRPAIFTGGGFGPTYYDFRGQPAGTQLDWYPTFAEGTFTGQSQAAWSISGNANYISYGGEFPTVNGTKQQGLVRFAIRSIAPNKVGPTDTATLTPTVVSQSAGSARVGWEAAWDQDNTTLTYALTRDGSTTPISTQTVNSTFFNRPPMFYIDKGLTPGSTHTYRVRATDPLGNTFQSPSTSVTIGSATTDDYSAAVLADGAQAFWPLSESAGSALAYDHSGGADLAMGAHGTFGVAGPHAGSSAVSFQGDPTIPGGFIPPFTFIDPIFSASTAGAASTAPPLGTYSVEAWVKTTSATGGLIVGDGLWQSADSQVVNRLLYLDAAGDVRFGVYNAGVNTTIASVAPINDGSWHHVVGTVGASGGDLYVDGVKVAGSAAMADTSVYYGHWRVGGDSLSGWPSAPANGYLAASIADVAVYPTALSAAAVLAHYGSGAVGASAPIARFTSACTAESCAFDASTSSDTGGTIATYSWNFGDGSPVVTGASATRTHVYPTAASYNVTLTITDDTASTSVVSHTVTPNFGAGNPVAAFTTSCAGLACTFDATGSTDTGGTITTYRWDFGDGTPVVTGASPTVNHTYAASSFYVVALKVTDNTTSVSSASNFVFPVAASGPVAAFTSTCTALSCSFNGSSSSDTGGTITGYSWNFGDGSALGTGATPTHVYAAAGNYTVSLTVTDNTAATNSVSHAVAPVSGGGSTPVAAFTSTCTSLSCAFTDTSTDTGGTITGWSWNFGDGSALGSGATPTHVYAAAGTYTVTLTVTDNTAATNAISHSVAPTSGTVTFFASDTFNRTVTGGLGTADVGGAWTRVGTASDFSVAPGTASFLMPTASTQLGAYLPSVSKTSAETDTTFTTDKAATGTGGIYVYVTGRRVSTNNEYDTRIRITSANTVAVELTKLVGSTTVTVVKSEVVLSGVTYTPGMPIHVRLQVSGTSPTTIAVKVWAGAAAEPSAWTLTATDTSAALQAAGAVGLTTYLSGSTTNAPTTVRFSTFTAGPLQP